MPVYGSDVIPACADAEEISSICRIQIDATDREIVREKAQQAELQEVLFQGRLQLGQPLGAEDENGSRMGHGEWLQHRYVCTLGADVTCQKLKAAHLIPRRSRPLSTQAMHWTWRPPILRSVHPQNVEPCDRAGEHARGQPGRRAGIRADGRKSIRADGRESIRADGRKSNRADVQPGGRVLGRAGGWADGRVGGRVARSMDGRVDGRVDISTECLPLAQG